MPAYNINKIFDAFHIYGDFVKADSHEGGHINDTFVATVNQAGQEVRYIFQHIIQQVFPEPHKVMKNICRITEHLRKKYREDNRSDSSRATLTVVPTKEGSRCFIDDDGNYWRCYLFIEGAIGHDVIKTSGEAFLAGQAFGEFQKNLADLPGKRLYENIPDFHNTPKRFDSFERSVAFDRMKRAQLVQEEIAFFRERSDIASQLIDLHQAGELPERVTHNDAKLNNILINPNSHEPACVIDLDTAMPGFAAYDFGDLMRSSLSPVAEDEKDVSKIYIQNHIFEGLAIGYLSTAAHFLTEVERDTLVLGGKLMALECGVRFLSDYIEGDTYFKTKYDEHNLVRCRTQIALLRCIEDQEAAMNNFIKQEYQKVKKS